MTTKIVKIGNSKGVIIPSKVLAMLGLTENDELLISEEEGAIIMKKTAAGKQTVSFSKRMEQFYKMPADEIAKKVQWDTQEEDWGSPVGKESW